MGNCRYKRTGQGRHNQTAAYKWEASNNEPVMNTAYGVKGHEQVLPSIYTNPSPRRGLINPVQWPFSWPGCPFTLPPDRISFSSWERRHPPSFSSSSRTELPEYCLKSLFIIGTDNEQRTLRDFHAAKQEVWSGCSLISSCPSLRYKQFEDTDSHHCWVWACLVAS